MPREQKLDASCQLSADGLRSNVASRRSFLASGMATVAAATLSPVALAQPARDVDELRTKFRRISTQFIAALGDPDASSGSGAQDWGLWHLDPGPRGVRLNNYERLKAADGVAPAQWKFNDSDWWLEEHGLIMEAPEFPVSPGQYLVTGDRDVTSVLTIYPMESGDTQRWELDNGATLHDVTHLACRSARYTPTTSGSSCSPAQAQMTEFPVSPGGAMPPVQSCNKQDYAVLLVIGVAV
jgi:hypothetical protein